MPIRNNPKRHKFTKTAIAGFGAALAANYGAPELQAGIVTLNFDPESAPFTTGSVLNEINIHTSGGDFAAGFSQWNDSIGKSMQFSANKMQSWALKNDGDVISASSFSGLTTGFYFTTAAVGTQFVAFRALAANGGGVGWFAFYLGDTARDDIVYTGGSQFADAGESLTVGTGYSSPDGASGSDANVVPEPGTATIGLSLLALGAAGLRRRRAAMRK